MDHHRPILINLFLYHLFSLDFDNFLSNISITENFRDIEVVDGSSVSKTNSTIGRVESS